MGVFVTYEDTSREDSCSTHHNCSNVSQELLDLVMSPNDVAYTNRSKGWGNATTTGTHHTQAL